METKILFESLSVSEFNTINETALEKSMTFAQVVDELDNTETNYFYISMNINDVIEAYNNEKEIADQLGLWFIYIEQVGVYVAIHP